MKYILLLVALVAITCAEQEDFSQDLNALVKQFPILKPMGALGEFFCQTYPEKCRGILDQFKHLKETDDEVKLQIRMIILPVYKITSWIYKTFFQKKK